MSHLFYGIFVLLVYFAACMYLNGREILGLRLEFALLLSSCISTSIFYLVSKSVLGIVDESQNMTAQLIIATFYSSYFPLIYIALIKKDRLQIGNNFYYLDSLYLKAKQMYSEENILFLKQYQSYLSNKSAERANQLIIQFILRNSKNQLNIDEYLRTSVCEDSGKLILVHEQIIELVRSNILPFVTDK
eukprot:NODE_131_length_18300_cov_0.442668.p9 type:complete len:189 gc:universal NODE_131_length_18300_cov_0.442668:132-698(+)